MCAWCISTCLQHKGFISYERKPLPYRPEFERVKDWKEVGAGELGYL
jgi:glutamate synthase (NADPH/NADH)